MFVDKYEAAVPPQTCYEIENQKNMWSKQPPGHEETHYPHNMKEREMGQKS